MCKGAYHQAQQPEVDLKNLHGGSREMTLKNCPLTSTSVLQNTCTLPVPHKEKQIREQTVVYDIYPMSSYITRRTSLDLQDFLLMTIFQRWLNSKCHNIFKFIPTKQDNLPIDYNDIFNQLALNGCIPLLCRI